MAPKNTAAAFQAYYLQRATAELAEDLDQLRTAPDFVVPGAQADGPQKKEASSSESDNSLQVLIGALRQGADMFSEADQARVMAAGEKAASKASRTSREAER